MQFVDQAHDREIGGRNGPPFVTETALAQIQEFRPPAEREFVLTVDHRLRRRPKITASGRHSR